MTVPRRSGHLSFFSNRILLHGRGNLMQYQTSVRFLSKLVRFMTSSDLKHSWFIHLTVSYCYPALFSFSYKYTSSPVVCRVQLWRLLNNVVVHPKITHNVCVSLCLPVERSTAPALNSNSQKSLWKYVRNASWATGKAARMCFCGDWDFTNPATGSIRHSKQTLWDYWEL